jgi:hypothetical protein
MRDGNRGLEMNKIEDLKVSLGREPSYNKQSWGLFEVDV